MRENRKVPSDKNGKNYVNLHNDLPVCPAYDNTSAKRK